MSIDKMANYLGAGRSTLSCRIIESGAPPRAPYLPQRALPCAIDYLCSPQGPFASE